MVDGGDELNVSTSQSFPLTTFRSCDAISYDSAARPNVRPNESGHRKLHVCRVSMSVVLSSSKGRQKPARDNCIHILKRLWQLLSESRPPRCAGFFWENIKVVCVYPRVEWACVLPVSRLVSPGSLSRALTSAHDNALVVSM